MSTLKVGDWVSPSTLLKSSRWWKDVKHIKFPVQIVDISPATLTKGSIIHFVPGKPDHLPIRKWHESAFVLDDLENV